MSGPTNKGIGGDKENYKELNLDNEEPKEAVTAGLSSDDIGINAKAGGLSNPINPINMTGAASPQDLKDINDASRLASASGHDSESATKQYNDGMSGAGDGRVAGTMFEHIAKKKKEDEKHKYHAHNALHISGDMYGELDDALNDLANRLDESNKELEDLAEDATLTIYELEEQRNEALDLLKEQTKQLEEMKSGDSNLLMGYDKNSEMGKARIALKEAEINNTKSHLKLVDTTIERATGELQGAQEAYALAQEKITDLRDQLKDADGNENKIKELQLELTSAEEAMQTADNKLDSLRESSKLNLGIIELSQEAKAISMSCGANASVEMKKVATINASTAMVDKLAAATSDGKLSKAEVDDLKDSFKDAGINERTQRSFIDTYVSAGGSVGTGELDSNNQEIFLEGGQASTAFMEQLDLAIAEKEVDIAANLDTADQEFQKLNSLDARSVELAGAAVDTVNNASRVVDVIKDTAGNEVYINKGVNGAEDTYHYIGQDGAENKYDPSAPEDAAQIERFKMGLDSNPSMFSLVQPLPNSNTLSSTFNAQENSGLSAFLNTQPITPATPKRFANEELNSEAYIAMAKGDIARDDAQADQVELETMNQIKEKIASGYMPKQEGREALAEINNETPALKTSNEMQVALQDVYTKIEGGSVSREDLEQALGADASPELKQQMETALERDGIDIQEPDNTNDATAPNTTYALASQMPGIGPLEYSPIQTQTFQPDANNIYAAPSPGSFADSDEFSATNPIYAIGSEPTYIATTNNRTENVPQAGETFAMAQANQLNNNSSSSQSSITAEDALRLQREAELRLAENSMGPANQGGGAGGAI